MRNCCRAVACFWLAKKLIFFLYHSIGSHQPRRVISFLIVSLPVRCNNRLVVRCVMIERKPKRTHRDESVDKKTVTYAFSSIRMICHEQICFAEIWVPYAWQQNNNNNNNLHYVLTRVGLVRFENNSYLHCTLMCVVAILDGLIKYYKYFMSEINRSSGMAVIVVF